ncbi:hypothetical protein MRX96_057887 [Rhipicephalus microplus]
MWRSSQLACAVGLTRLAVDPDADYGAVPDAEAGVFFARCFRTTDCGGRYEYSAASTIFSRLGATFVVSAVFKVAASTSSSSSANKGHTAISTSTFYSVLKERPKRFVHANLLDVIDPNESDFSADEKKSDEEVSGDSSDEGDAIQTEVKEAEEEVATSTDAPPVDRNRTPRNTKRRYTWVKKDFDIEAGSFENNFPLPPAEPLSAVEYFDMFVSRSMLKAVVDESNKYYFQKHGTTLNLTVEKLTPVLGMFFRMGLVNMHR